MKILFLCLVATLAMAQDEMDMNNTVSTLSMERLAQLVAIQDNYNQSIAVDARRAHLFCLNRTTDENTGEVTITEFEQRGEYVWTLYFQIPLLTFLDPQRKLSLMDTVLKVLDNGYTLNDICLGTYETTDLSYFGESLLIRVYSRDPSNPIMASDWANRFNLRVTNQVGDENGYVISYPGQDDVIALNFSTSSEYTNLILPAVETNEGVDLSSLAVFIGSYGFNITFAYGVNDTVSRQFNSGDGQRSMASNTNPINYGLEAGDIVFAVIGSILLTIAGGLIILGYCIHPFFLA